MHNGEPARAWAAARTLCAVALGCAMALTVRGYQFGRSNHTVYLVDALRVNDLRLLAGDWFATRTLQYHVAFTRMTAALDRAGVVKPAFLGGYLLLVVAWQWGWWRTAAALGGTEREYLMSVVFYLLSAGGFGLGMYDFLQDAAFLPSNIANVAMLWGVCWWIRCRPMWCGLALGVAGFFHLNHAIVGMGLWFGLMAWNFRFGGRPVRRPWKGIAAGTVALVALCIPSVVTAARAAVVGAGHSMSLAEFVDLYVRLRHPHHYDAASWPVALWVSFLWPIPLAVIAARRAAGRGEVRRAGQVFLVFCGLLVVALLFAGVWYVSEPLVQMSLYRFSIYTKLLSCVGAAMYLYGESRRPVLAYLVLAVAALAFLGRWLLASRMPSFIVLNIDTLVLLLLLLLCCAMYELVAGMRPRKAAALLAIPAVLALVSVIHSRLGHHHLLGLRTTFEPGDPRGYRDVCEFAREQTPIEAMFLVPPNEEEFRVTARRAIVVNFKGVPQLSGELGEWRDRLCRVLDLPNLDVLPRRRFDRTMEAISRRYDELPADHLIDVARHYGARYIVTTRELAFAPPARHVFESGRFHLYDLVP
jgi:hypothetical protein